MGVNTRGFFGANHTYNQAGSFTVTTIVSDDDGGTSQQQFTVAVGPPPSLELSIDKSTVAEDAGANAATMTIKRVGFDTATALSVLLTSSDTSELQLPSSVIIPAGQFSITFPAQAIDDTLLDGTVRVAHLEPSECRARHLAELGAEGAIDRVRPTPVRR